MITRRTLCSGIDISPLALGCNVFGWTADRDASFEVLDGFLAGGGDLLDTADGYSHWHPGNSGGESETVIGQWLASRGSRDRVVIASKVSTHPRRPGLAPANVRAALEDSLGRLGTDRLDLYYAHFDDPDTPLEQTARAFSQLVDEGKVRAIGVSNYTADRVAEWMRIAREGGLHAPVALQPQYSLVERDFETNGLRAIAEAEGLAVLPYFALARGFLTGKYRSRSDAQTPGASPRAGDAVNYLDHRGEAILGALDEIAAAHDVDVASVALAWLREQPTVVAPIASARSTEQLRALLAALTLELDADELRRLSAAGA